MRWYDLADIVVVRGVGFFSTKGILFLYAEDAKQFVFLRHAYSKGIGSFVRNRGSRKSKKHGSLLLLLPC